MVGWSGRGYETILGSGGLMPSSGYGMAVLIDKHDAKNYHAKATRLVERAKLAISHDLFVEWFECFVAAWEATKDIDIASWAGVEEWDM